LKLDSGGSEFVARRGYATASSGVDGETKEGLLVCEEKEPNIEFATRHECEPCGRGEFLRKGLFEKVVYTEKRDGPMTDDRPMSAMEVVDEGSRSRAAAMLRCSRSGSSS
jgi:hypothetical protein